MLNLSLVHNPQTSQFLQISNLISLYELDDRSLLSEQFICITQQEEVIAFGRIKEHDSCSELCSLGVKESRRLQGFGKRLVTELIQKATQPLYLVCIIPDYFGAFGFEVCHVYPYVMEEKLNYCTSELIVSEPYVVMKYAI